MICEASLIKQLKTAHKKMHQQGHMDPDVVMSLTLPHVSVDFEAKLYDVTSRDPKQHDVPITVNNLDVFFQTDLNTRESVRRRLYHSFTSEMLRLSKRSDIFNLQISTIVLSIRVRTVQLVSMKSMDTGVFVQMDTLETTVKTVMNYVT